MDNTFKHADRCAEKFSGRDRDDDRLRTGKVSATDMQKENWHSVVFGKALLDLDETEVKGSHERPAAFLNWSRTLSDLAVAITSCQLSLRWK